MGLPAQGLEEEPWTQGPTHGATADQPLSADGTSCLYTWEGQLPSQRQPGLGTQWGRAQG